MSVLAVPDGGFHLEGSEASEFLPMQAFGIALSDSVIEDMINCVQNGSQIELFLGNNPSLQYGEYEEELKPTAESLDYDLFLTNLNESKTKAHRLPNPTMSILKRPPPGANKALNPQIRVDKAAAGKGGKASKAKLPHGKSAMAMALSGSSTTRSLPTSPALTGVGSPLHNPAIAASQQQLEKNKGQRSTLVHELAVGDQTYDYLKQKWDGAEADLTTTLGKVADKIGPKYSMKKIYWKELDVWNYKYEPSENRQKAIENARKQYDKQRLETKDPAWERLLEEKDRGKGIILSKLQAAIAKGNMTPAVKPTRADDASSRHSSDESVKGKTGGESMARSTSQPIGSKPKKVSDREALSKSLLSNKVAATKKAALATKKAAPANKPSKVQPEKGGKKILSEEFVLDSSSDDEAPLASTTTTTATTTTARSKPLPKPTERKVERSIEKPPEKPKERKVERSFEKPPEKPKERSPVPPKPKERSPVPPPKAKERTPPAPISKPTERSPAPASKPKERSPVPAPKPKANKPMIRAPRPATTTAKPSIASTAQKRPREEEDSSSSSGAPLSKKIRPKELTTSTTKTLPGNTTLKHRPSDASQNSRGTPSINSYKSKNTSPAKSSPLASSPPTNASDFDDSSNSGQSHHHNHDRDRERERERGRERDRPAAPRTNGHVAATNGNTPNGVHSAKKRPIESQNVSSQSLPKKSRVSKDVLDKAHRFDKFYERYRVLHDQLARVPNPPRDKLDDLLDMRERLVHLKAEIRREVEPAA
ncbi:hypothetical protein TruAng_010673 [Truncatella angustata]|nr:hypothetical protein TruAng_010673 [Truncatella angustata]